ncbi:STAS/SEC14 domain-containing protein [Pseudoalteromonas sp. CO325X]|uniref:STAS/SEC14 domain-containing protein n=1 Tax=Pseudoalteromonas sp. CO325X TaxID=1777262 RepID=UPI001022F189|nr:STAS/SEC14 domain-containing protein [Pseudoalteromonas sp. CO325X]RZF80886.1 STAS/SEC14 domain-containing protein [Pseudoalteromonas sp. CO325X]
MLNITINETHNTALLEPQGQLTAEDFAAAVRIIDPYIEQHAKLHALIIATEHFPGWDSFAALLSHLQFVRDHHKKVNKVAIATNSLLGDFAQQLGAHFIHAEVKSFRYEQREQAKQWAQSP